jgi:hypothetical protein
VKKHETASLLNARWKRLKSVFTRWEAGHRPGEGELIPSEVTRPAMGAWSTIQAKIQRGVSFPTHRAENEIKPHFFRLWQTELRLGKRAERFEFMHQEQESLIRCHKNFPAQFSLVYALNALVFPEIPISVGVAKDGRSIMLPLAKPYPILSKPKFLWVACVPTLTKAENMQRMAAAYGVYTDREDLRKRFNSSLARHEKRKEREGFYISVARFYAAQPEGKRLWNTAEHFYPVEFEQAQAECHKYRTREIPPDLKQKIVDAVKQGKKIEKWLAGWQRVGKAAPKKRKVS